MPLLDLRKNTSLVITNVGEKKSSARKRLRVRYKKMRKHSQMPTFFESVGSVFSLYNPPSRPVLSRDWIRASFSDDAAAIQGDWKAAGSYMWIALPDKKAASPDQDEKCLEKNL